MPETIEGLDEVLKNLHKAEADILKATERGMEIATIKTESHIKTEYQRAVTGKGFDNRTGKLRASIRQKVDVIKTKVIGWIIAGSGEVDYAPYVEFRWSGKYAYMWSGVNDMRKEIFRILEKELKGVFK